MLVREGRGTIVEARPWLRAGPVVIWEAGGLGYDVAAAANQHPPTSQQPPHRQERAGAGSTVSRVPREWWWWWGSGQSE